jgi:hypothetical protein
MKKILLFLFLLATPLGAQTIPHKAIIDSLLVVRRAQMDALIRTDSVLAWLYRDTITTPVPPPVDTTTPPVPTDTTVRIYAQHNFNDNTGGPFTGLAGAPCDTSGFAKCVNGRVEILYERLDTASAGDRNRGIKWVPKAGIENTPFGATLYMAGTWTIPSRDAANAARINAVATALGLPVQTDTVHERLQRKLIYGNPGRSNHFVLKIHALNLQFSFSTGGGAPCSTTQHVQPTTVHRFTDDELFDKPQRIELLVKRASGVRVPDGEATVWLNGNMVRHITGLCTNEDTNTSWQVQFGQQISYTSKTGELWSELRLLDDVIVANKRPF